MRTSRSIAFATLLLTVSIIASACARPPGGTGRALSAEFDSQALHRTMPYEIYLPPGYDAGANQSRRYPTIYLLHGLAAHDDQWESLGIETIADRLIRAGTIAPVIIVMPEGEESYWVDHVNGGPRWGEYVAADLVKHIDATYRTMPGADHRAIGGISMGAHGAVQLALTYPGTFSVVGAHSLVLRPPTSAPPYFGTGRDFAARDPMALVRAQPQTARAFALWIDIGVDDEWAPLAEQFDRELTALKIPHQWHEWPGGHTNAYWTSHLEEYLRYYDLELGRRAPFRVF